VDFTYSGRDWIFFTIFIALAVLILFATGGSLNGRGLVEASLEFVKSWLALKGL
jgi:hypothetical protein